MPGVTEGAVLNRMYRVVEVLPGGWYRAEDRDHSPWLLRQHYADEEPSRERAKLFHKAFTRLRPLMVNGQAVCAFQLPRNAFADSYGYFSVYPAVARLPARQAVPVAALGSVWQSLLSDLEKLHKHRVCHGGITADAIRYDDEHLAVSGFAYFDLLPHPGDKDPEEVLDSAFAQHRGEDVKASAAAVLQLYALSRGRDPGEQDAGLADLEDRTLREWLKRIIDSAPDRVPQAAEILAGLKQGAPPEPICAPGEEATRAAAAAVDQAAAAPSLAPGPVTAREPVTENEAPALAGAVEEKAADPGQRGIRLAEIPQHVSGALPRPAVSIPVQQPRPARLAILLSLIVFLVAAIGWAIFVWNPWRINPPSPEILKFHASGDEIQAGQTIAIEWDVKNAAEVEIEPRKLLSSPAARLNPQGKIDTIPLTNDVTFKLKATGASGDHKVARCDVKVYQQKKLIQYFHADPDKVSPGQPVTLRWATEGADRTQIRVNDGKPEQMTSTSWKHVPQVTTTYLLEAFGAGTMDWKEVTVHVAQPPPSPRIVYFRVRVHGAIAGQEVNVGPEEELTLEWQVENASLIQISHVGAFFGSAGSTVVKPPASTVYELRAIGKNGSQTAQSLSVRVHPKPEVELTVSPNKVLAGNLGPEPVEVRWTARHAQEVQIEPLGIFGVVQVEGKCLLYPDKSMTIRAIARGPGGVAEDKEVVTVEPLIKPPPGVPKCVVIPRP